MAQQTYRIVVDGRLSDRFADGFENMTQHQVGPDTVLEGNLVDQAQLHGLLDRIRGLGINVISFATTGSPSTAEDAAGER